MVSTDSFTGLALKWGVQSKVLDPHVGKPDTAFQKGCHFVLQPLARVIYALVVYTVMPILGMLVHGIATLVTRKDEGLSAQHWQAFKKDACGFVKTILPLFLVVDLIFMALSFNDSRRDRARLATQYFPNTTSEPLNPLDISYGERKPFNPLFGQLTEVPNDTRIYQEIMEMPAYTRQEI